MAPNQGLVHQKEYDWRDSNVELVGSDLDHKVKHASAATEPAWQGLNSAGPGLHVWRIEDFEVVPWPRNQYGQFHEGDSYIVLHTQQVGQTEGAEKLIHDIFFWLGSHTTQDEAGTAAYKTVELDEFLKGTATQHRELQRSPSDEFAALFPRLRILRGGVKSGFRHVEEEEEDKEETVMLLRIFRYSSPSAGPRKPSADTTTVVHEVAPDWRSLDDGDVFVLERRDKIWVWQGRECSPMEKAKAAQVVHDMTLAKHVDVEVVAQTESRSRTIVGLLGGDNDTAGPFRAPRPVISASVPADEEGGGRPRRLFRLSDASGQLRFDVVKEGSGMGRSDLQSDDVFLLDNASHIWVWQGAGASRAERAAWIKVAESYLRNILDQGGSQATAHLSPISKVVEGLESPAFMRALESH